MTHICTKDNPWEEGIPTPVRHVDAKVVYSHERESSCDDGYDRYECPNCGMAFKETLPSH
ncbi:MAG: hypothetical protein GY941_20120 [Planctomycetes bacterium]|nr:hypothetical protein [Planctomycetota bacterium]